MVLFWGPSSCLNVEIVFLAKGKWGRRVSYRAIENHDKMYH
jgi:hypothetical protein